jgi:hypothetical protein
LREEISRPETPLYQGPQDCWEDPAIVHCTKRLQSAGGIDRGTYIGSCNEGRCSEFAKSRRLEERHVAGDDQIQIKR